MGFAEPPFSRSLVQQCFDLATHECKASQKPEVDEFSLSCVLLVALRQARPRRADGMGRLGQPLRRSTRRYSSQREEFNPKEMTLFSRQSSSTPYNNSFSMDEQSGILDFE